MKMNPLKTFLTLIAISATALCASAQTAKIMVVDMARVYDSHYKTEEQNAKLRGDEQRAQEELEKLNAEGNVLVEQYKELSDQAKNPALSNEAKAKAEQDAQVKLEEIQRKQNEVQNFRVNTQRGLQQRIKNFRDILLEEISKIAVDLAKSRGATLLLDKSGPSLLGISNVLYADTGYDITDAVLAEVNKNRPAGSAAPAATTSATGEEPTVKFPGSK